MTQTASLFLQDSYREECLARITDLVEDGLLLEQTVFYPQGGGQAGDSGWLTLADGTRLRIADTRKGTEAGAGRDAILHIPAEGQATVLRAMKPGEVVLAQIDWVRRYRHMRLHTAAHMLCAVLPYPVNGCSITDEHARLDFVTSEPLSREAIDSALAAMVEAAHPVSIDTMSDDALRARPDLVRTMSVQPPMGAGQVRLVSIKDTDLQPCGGTHVANTEEVGVVRVSKMEKKSARYWYWVERLPSTWPSVSHSTPQVTLATPGSSMQCQRASGRQQRPTGFDEAPAGTRTFALQWLVAIATLRACQGIARRQLAGGRRPWAAALQ